MKTLKDHVILYDNECPLCKLYTHAFTATGMLDNEGRAPYQDMSAFTCPTVDPQRAVNEIALVNKTTGEVNYGIESLFKIIAHSFPLFKPLFSNKPFIALMRKVYAFISYNRKVIIPAPTTTVKGPQPSFKLKYRIAWLLFTIALAGCILTAYAHLLTGLLPLGAPYREYAVCTGQILFQGAIVSLYARRKKWDYLGNMMTISLAGALLLLPMLAIAAFVQISALIAVGYFMMVVGLMLLEHIRRSKLLSLGWTMTISWVVYRLIILLIIR